MRCPYRCTNTDFGYNDCLSSPGRVPEDGDVGLCAYCGGWWTLVDGECQPHMPTLEQMEDVLPHMAESRKRAAAHAQSIGRRLKS